MDGITQNESVLAIEDYVVFTGLLAFSTCIGLFFAYFDSKKDDEDYDDESAYLVGNRSVSKTKHYFFYQTYFVEPSLNNFVQLSAWPVALSLTASFMSSITVISTPAEIYYYGTMFLWFLLSYILVSFIVNYLYMPFFYRQGESKTVL